MDIMFNATVNNISVISWRSGLWVEEPENITDLPKGSDKLYHIMLYRVHLAWAGFELPTLVVIVSDCIGSCKSNTNYHNGTSFSVNNQLLLATKIIIYL